MPAISRDTRGRRWPRSTIRSSAAFTRLDKIPYFFLERYPESFAAELDHFLAVIEGRETPLISAEDGRRALLADAATSSFHSGRPVALDY